MEIMKTFRNLLEKIFNCKEFKKYINFSYNISKNEQGLLEIKSITRTNDLEELENLFCCLEYEKRNFCNPNTRTPDSFIRSQDKKKICKELSIINSNIKLLLKYENVIPDCNKFI